MSTTIAARRGRPGLTDRLVPVVDAQSVVSAEDQVSAARLAAFSKAHGPPAPAHASPPPSIIPAPPAPPGAPNITEAILQDGPYTLASGSYVYGAELAYLFASGSGFLGPLVNNGVIWSSVSSNVSTLLMIGRYNSVREVTNNGTIVLRTGADVTFGTLAFAETGLDNSGSIYVLAAGASGAELLSSSLSTTFHNSGLIAVQSAGSNATGYSLGNGGLIANSAGGSILIEGESAIAISLGRGGLFDSVHMSGVTNDGRIEARATDPEQLSFAIIASHYGNDEIDLVNRGTIKADIAYASSYSTTTAQPGPDVVTNEATGRIEGYFFLDRGDDTVTNRGTIVGGIFMEEGDDHVDNSGTIDGFTDLGWGADSYVGAAGADFVAGNDGNDLIEGNGGNDQLMGGGNDDRLVGGAGNDGLFGEYGNDVIVTLGSDYVSGGAGDDRIEAGDYSFEIIDGGAGFDTLVLPAGGRAIDLSAVLAQGRLAEIEQITLSGGQTLFVRAADIGALTGGETTLRVTTSATDALDLVGAWAAGANQRIDGVSYRSYALSGATVLVAGGGTVVTNAGAGGSGLDSVSGALAPVPGDPVSIDFTDPSSFVDDYELSQSVVVNPEEIWYSADGHAVLTSFNAHVTITNYGAILSFRDLGSGALTPAFGVGTGFSNFESLINFGRISVLNLDPASGGTFGFANANNGSFENHGSIETYAVYGTSQAVETTAFSNDGVVRATVETGQAIGVRMLGRDFDNRGEISVSAVGGDQIFPFYGLPVAVGIWMREGDHSNSGSITATSANGSVGIWYELAGDASLTNSGTIAGDAAVHVRGGGSLHIINTGLLAGRVEFDLANDRIDNSGTITGKIMLGAGNDIFDGHAGAQAAGVYGEAGDDRLTGGSAIDSLHGGDGADILQGGGGSDYLEGGAGADTFLYTATGDSQSYWLRSDGAKDKPDIIVDFKHGEDRIDLSQIDAVAGTGTNDAFTFIGTGAFSHHAGELRYDVHGGTAQVYADVDGDGYADFQLAVTTPTLQAGDFVL